MVEFFAGIGVWAGTFFVIGTLWFWVVSAIFFSWLIFLTEGKSHFFACAALFGFVWIVSSVNGFSILAEPLVALKWTGLYLLVGFGWSFLKWFSFLFSKRDEVEGYKSEFVKRFGQPLTAEGKVHPQDLDDFIKFLNDKRYSPSYDRNAGKVESRQDIIPGFGNHSGDFTRWMVWWPFSAFWTILNDPLRRLAEAIIRMFRGAYTALANRVFENVI